MKLLTCFPNLLLLGIIVLGLTFASCSSDKNDPDPDPDPDPITEVARPYVFSIYVEGAYYVLDTDKLNEGNTVTAIGQGIEQTGYHDYLKFGNTVVCIGGNGIVEIKGVTRNAQEKLQQKGSFVLDKTRSNSEITQVDDNTIVIFELTRRTGEGDAMKLYVVDLNTLAITNTATIPFSSLVTHSSGDDVIWPIPTGASYNNNKLYLSYYEENSTQRTTPWTNEAQVAVISYPSLQFDRVITDPRTGPLGSWQAHSGMFQTENGDTYLMSNSSIPNGYTQSTKPASFTRIPKGSTTFDSYYFDFSAAAGGLRPAHVKYIGGGLVFAEVSTNLNPTLDDRYGDKALKSCIINLTTKTVTDISGLPVHDGQGARHFMAVADKGFVYVTVPTGEGLFVYQVNPTTATAVRGAKVSAEFVAGFFRVDK